MTFAFILVGAFGLLELWFFAYNVKTHNENAERAVELDKHEVSLKEREDRNRDDFLSLAEMEEKEAVYVESGYLVTESDEMKYLRDSAIFSAARSKIAHNIAYDLIHKFPDPDVEYVGPRKKYSYRFRVSRIGEGMPDSTSS